MRIASKTIYFLMVLMLSLSGQAMATNKKFVHHTVCYNAFPGDTLPVQMTQKYDIKRSKNMALINITVLKNNPEHPGQGIAAQVSGVMQNLMGQKKKLTFREVHEGNAWYYLAEVKVEHDEVVNFFIHVKTKDGQDYDVTFSKKFMTR